MKARMAKDFVLEFERPILELEEKIAELRRIAASGKVDCSREIENLDRKARKLRKEIFQDLGAWQRTQLSRHPQRPYTLDYVRMLFTDWYELHGDRNFMDDQAIVCGLARFDGRPVAVIGHQKGRNTKENVVRNFGMPFPEGYRKALRIMNLAERYRRPILTFIDTPGAYPGIEAEARGQAEAIAKNIMVMSSLRVPVVCTVIGEGGSGGALAVGVGNRVLMLENSIYSVISPEACAAILWKDQSKGEVAAGALRYTAPDCHRLGVADEVVPEPLGGAHRDPEGAARELGDALRRHLEALRGLGPDELAADRYQRVRHLGRFSERGRRVNGVEITFDEDEPLGDADR